VTETESEWLAKKFEENRVRLRAVAYRMLGSSGEADDAVQEAWLRLSRSDASGIENLGGWLTTVVARICLDMLRSRRARREEPLWDDEPDPAGIDGRTVGGSGGGSGLDSGGGLDPEREALLADAIGPAMFVVLETLAPAERVAFVLHDMFAVPFDEVAAVTGRSPAAARQLASRARRRVQGSARPSVSDFRRHRQVVDAFLAASREGNLDALLALLDPEAVLRADAAAVRMGAEAEVRGARAVAETFKGRATAARRAVVDGDAGAMWAPGGKPRVVFGFTIVEGKIVRIDLLADQVRLQQLDLVLPTGGQETP
jgi:RNA polymerase sigma factor (sigma-70 family)